MVGFKGFAPAENIAQRLTYALDNGVKLLNDNKFQSGELPRAMLDILVDIEHFLNSQSANDAIANSVGYFLEFSGIVSIDLSFRNILESVIDDLLFYDEDHEILKSKIVEESEAKSFTVEALIVFFLQFCIQLSTISSTVKLALHSDEIMKKLIPAIDAQIPSTYITTDLTTLFLSLCELGVSQNELQKLYQASSQSKEEVSIFQKMLSLYPRQHKSLLLEPGSQFTFDKLRLHDIRNGFTISTWIRLNSMPLDDFKSHIDKLPILSLSDDDNIPVIDYSIVGNFLSLSVVDLQMGLEDNHTFEEFELQPMKLYHIVLVHKPNSNLTSYKIDLFIDGGYINSYTTSFPIIKRKGGPGFAASKKSKKLSLTFQNGSSSYSLIEVINILLVNDCLKLEWILVSLSLGPLYSGNYQDKSIFDSLSYDSKLNINLKLQEANDLYGKEFLVKEFENLRLESMNEVPSINLDISNIALNFHSMEVQSDDQNLILFNERTSAGYVRVIVPQERIHYWNPRLLGPSVNALGGFALFLSAIEGSKTTEVMLSSLNLLFSLLSNNNEFLIEFESKNGYDILTTLLKTKNELVTIDVLDSILGFIGYDFQCPSDSILKNILAYKSLIADFEIWNSHTRHEDNATAKSRSNETFKFLIFQFTVFGQDSRYHSYNSKRLMKMKIIKRIVQALKSGYFDKDVLPVLHDSLLILLRSNPTSENLRSLSLYVLYALNSTEGDTTLQVESGATVLKVLSTIVAESLSPINPSQKRILKCINIKWILLLFQDKNIEVIKQALKLLFQTLKALDSKSYKQFMDPLGMTILSSFLKDHWRIDEINMLIFGAIFGLVYSSEMGPDLPSFSSNIFHSISPYQITMPEFFFIFSTMINEALNAISNKDIIETDSIYFDAIGILSSYVKILETGTREVPSFHSLSHDNVRWLSEGLGILLKISYINKQREDHNVDDICSRLKDFYSNIFIEKVFSLEKQKKNIFLFVEEVSAHSKPSHAAMSLIIIPTLLEHYNVEYSVPRYEIDNTVGKLALHYLYSRKHVTWNFEDFELAIECIGNIIELDHKASIFGKNPTMKSSLYKNYSDVFLNYLINTIESQNTVDTCCADFIRHQNEIFLCIGGDYQKLTFLLCALWMCNLANRQNSLSLNALRMCFMQTENRHKNIASVLLSNSVNTFLEFAEEVSSLNDEELKLLLGNTDQLTNAIKKYYQKNTNLYLNLESTLQICELVIRPLGHSKNLDDSIKKVMKNEMIPLTKAVILYEQKSFDRHNQDNADDLQFYISMYNSIKAASPMEKFEYDWLLDSTEGPERMRTKIFPEPIIDTTEKLDIKNRGSLSNGGSKELNGSSRSGDDVAVSKLTDSISDDEEVAAAHEDKNRKVLRSLYVGDRISKMFNVTKILGLSTVESLMIVGITHLYLIENYFYNKDGDIIDIEDAPMESRDQYMQLIIDKPKTSQRRRGGQHRLRSWEISKLVSVSKRQFLLREVAIELFFIDGSNVLITCLNKDRRDKLVSILSSKIKVKHPEEDIFTALHYSTSSDFNSSSSSTTFTSKLANAFVSSQKVSFTATKKWCKGELSNFYYLMLINTLAGRTFNDLTQYPVFPWVIADYTSEELDFNDPKTFRDLSKPMGAQFESRANQFRERYEASEGIGAPPFHYGTHYSSSMIVAGYLIRLKPFINSYLLLQGGKLDHADRLFTSIGKAWLSASRDNTADVRELIPEFFYLSEFLENRNDFELGKMQDGTIVSDVELPPWAKGDAKIFIAKNREALESEYVSKHLHEWIDLIFGYKQQGLKAIENLNVFNHLSYHGAIDLDSIKDEHERHVMTSIIHNFGQTPLQIFTKPHPSRNNFEILDFEIKLFENGDFLELPSLSIIEKSSDTKSTNSPIERIDMDRVTHEWKGNNSGDLVLEICCDEEEEEDDDDDKLILNFNKETGTYKINGNIFESFNFMKVTCIELLGNSSFVIGYSNGILEVVKYTEHKSKFNEDTNSLGITNARSLDSNISDKLSNNNNNNNNNNNIKRLAILRGHFNEIKDIKVCNTFKVIISVDKSGVVKIWDSIKLIKIRELLSCWKVEFISISNETGNIITVSEGNYMEVFTLNGDSIIRKKVEDRENPSNKISCISIGELENLGHKSFKLIHEYWRHYLIISVGWTQRSTVSLYEVQLKTRWELKELKFFRSLVVSPAIITAIKLKFNIELNYEGKKIVKSELIAGDKNGRLLIWR